MDGPLCWSRQYRKSKIEVSPLIFVFHIYLLESKQYNVSIVTIYSFYKVSLCCAIQSRSVKQILSQCNDQTIKEGNFIWKFTNTRMRLSLFWCSYLSMSSMTAWILFSAAVAALRLDLLTDIMISIYIVSLSNFVQFCSNHLMWFDESFSGKI